MLGAYKRRQQAIENLKKVVEDPSKVLFIHYTQSRTYDDDYGGISPIITSIVVKSMDDQVCKHFALQFEADKAGIPKDEIQDSYRELEYRILKAFNDFVRRNTMCIWIHWDMKDINFGFEAIKHRFEKIFEGLDDYCEIPSNQKRNLRQVLEGMYGERFADGPDHFKDILICNSSNIEDPGYLTRDAESKEFESKNFDSVIKSVDVKVDFLRRATKKLLDRELKVLNKNNYAIFVDIVNHPFITFIGWLATIVGLGVGVYTIL
jgi:hypothetical protein